MQGISPLYDANEAQAMFRCYIADRLGIEPFRFFLDMKEEMENDGSLLIDIEKLSNGTPLQHVTGIGHFYGMELKVSPDVLIPRPETEELVERILADCRDKEGVRILDIGTGSGAIAIALAKNLPGAKVSALDISEKALSVAKENAERQQVRIDFLQYNILKINQLKNKYDIIVSNPPYIPESAKRNLHTNVVDHEPGIALFVPDDRPLIFYEKIAQLAVKSLNANGALYFETYEDFHKELESELRRQGYTKVDCWSDWFGRPRFVRAAIQ